MRYILANIFVGSALTGLMLGFMADKFSWLYDSPGWRGILYWLTQILVFPITITHEILSSLKLELPRIIVLAIGLCICFLADRIIKH